MINTLTYIVTFGNKEDTRRKRFLDGTKAIKCLERVYKSRFVAFADIQLETNDDTIILIPVEQCPECQADLEWGTANIGEDTVEGLKCPNGCNLRED